MHCGRFSMGGHVAMVMCAASGLELAIAEVLAQARAQVALADIDRQGLDRAVDRISAAGGRAEALTLDVSSREAIRQTTDSVVARHRRLDVMVANAGVTAGPCYLAETGQINAVDDEQWDRVLQISLTGVFATIQSAARHMRAQRSGRIIAIASVAGLKSDVMCGYAYTTTTSASSTLSGSRRWNSPPTT